MIRVKRQGARAPGRTSKIVGTDPALEAAGKAYYQYRAALRSRPHDAGDILRNSF